MSLLKIINKNTIVENYVGYERVGIANYLIPLCDSQYFFFKLAIWICWDAQSLIQSSLTGLGPGRCF